MSVIIQHKRGTASQWTSLNPTLAAGEVGWESDTNKFKIGTGSTAWNSLAYATLTPSELTSGYARLAFPNTFSVGGHIINNDAVGTIPLQINRIVGQTADLFQVVGNSGTFQITSSGALRSNINVGNSFGGGTSANNILAVRANVATNVPLIISGAASQSADLLQIQDISGNNNLSVSSTYGLVGRNAGTVSFALSSANGLGAFYSTAATNVPMTLRGAASQSVDLLQAQSSAGTVLAKIDKNGSFSGNYFGPSGAGLLGYLDWTTNTPIFNTGGTGVIGLIIKGASGQSANLLEARDSSNNTWASISPTGTFNSSSSTAFQIAAATYYGSLNSGQTARIQAGSSVAANPHVVIRQSSGATGDLLQIQNSSGSTLSSFDVIGNLFINKTSYGFSVSSAAPGSITYWKIATLPTSSAGTYDHVIIDAVLDDDWGSAQKVQTRILLSNRNAFTYRYYLNGTVRTNARILTYTEADGSISVYLRAGAANYCTFSYNITHGIDNGTIIYKNPSSTTTTPTGTLSFDSGVIATYVPQMYIPYTGAPQVQGNSIAYLASPTFTGTVTTSALTVNGLASFNNNLSAFGTSTLWANQQLSLAVRNGVNAPTDLVQYSSNDTTIHGGVTTDGSLWVGSTTPLRFLNYTLTAASASSTTVATYTTSSTMTVNPVVVGQKVIISSVTPSSYNGSFIVTAIGGSSGAWTFTVTAPSAPFVVGSATGFGTFSVDPAISIQQLSAGAPGLIIRAVASQSANPFEYRRSDSSLQTYITPAGDIVAPAISAIWSMTSSAQDVTVTALRARHSVANYRANLQTWENTSTVLAGVNAQGQFFTGGTTPIQGSTTVAINTQTPTGTTDISVTTASNHGISVGQTVVVAGITPAGYNGTWVARAGTTGTTLVLPIGSNPGAITVAGTVTQNSQVGITALSANNTPLVVRGAASQAANLLEVQSSTGSVLTRIASSGQIVSDQLTYIGSGATSISNGRFNVATGSASVVGAIIRGASGQSADLLQIQNNTPTNVFRVGPTGDATFGYAYINGIRDSAGTGPYIDTASTSLTINARSAANLPLIVQGASGQSSDLQRWNNSTPAVLSKVDSLGKIYIPGGSTIYDYSIVTSGGTDTAWKKLIEVTCSTGLYTGASYEIDVIDNLDNYAVLTNTPTKFRFHVKIQRSGGVQDDVVAAVVLGPSSDYVRVVKTSSSLYEIQIRQIDVYRVQTYRVKRLVTVNSFESYHPSGLSFTGLAAGSTTGTIYTAVNNSATYANFVVENFSHLNSNKLTVEPLGTLSTPTVIIKNAATQTSNMQEWQNSASTALSYIKPDGSLYINSNSNVTGIYWKGTASDQSMRANGNDLFITPRFDLIYQPTDTTGRLRPANDNQADLGTSGQRWKNLYAVGAILNGLTLSGASSPITLNGSVGTSGQVLTSAGAGATPTWTTVSGGSFTGGTLTSDLVLAAGSTTVEPLTFQSNSSTPTTTSGAMDYDGTVFYSTSNTNPGRGLNTQNYYYASSADYGPDFSTSASVQSMLGTSTRGITVAAGTTYEYEFYATVQHQYVTNTGITGTYQITSTTVSGSPTVAVVHQIDYGSNTTSFTTATTLSTIRTTGSVVFSAAISSGSRYNFIRAKGVIRVTGTGTTKIYPGLSLSAASGDNVWNIQNGLVFKLTPIGNGTVTTVGAWA